MQSISYLCGFIVIFKQDVKFTGKKDTFYTHMRVYTVYSQEARQPQVSIEFETLWSRVRYVIATLTTCGMVL